MHIVTFSLLTMSEKQEEALHMKSTKALDSTDRMSGMAWSHDRPNPE